MKHGNALNTVQEFLNIKKIAWIRLNDSIMFKRFGVKWLIKYSAISQAYFIYQDNYFVSSQSHIIELIRFMIQSFRKINKNQYLQ